MSAAALKVEYDPIERLKRDVASGLEKEDARFLVDTYYDIQHQRIALTAQGKAHAEGEEPHGLVTHLTRQFTRLEEQMKKALEVFSSESEVGQWCLAQRGLGPVLTAGFLAHIDIHKAPTVGHIWRFAGLDITSRWLGEKAAHRMVTRVCGKKGDVTLEHVAQCALEAGRRTENLSRMAATDSGNYTRTSLTRALARRPHNGKLKTLCWKTGESFVKSSGHEDSYYGRLYAERKVLEKYRNDNGEFEDQAKEKLANYNIGKQTEAYQYYSSGTLPPAHIHERAKRWAVKIFLSHLHSIWFELEFGKAAPVPYIIAHDMGHTHYLSPPPGPTMTGK